MRFSTFAPITLAIVAAALAACHTPAKHRPAQNAALQGEAAREIARICALPEHDRQAQIQKIKVESGVVVACPKP